MGFRAKDVVLSSPALQALQTLEANPELSASSIARGVRGLRPILLADCLHGEAVKKDRIPRALKDKHGAENLFVEDLPSFWRLLHTVVRDRGERYVVIIEIVDHGAYDRWFEGRRR